MSLVFRYSALTGTFLNTFKEFRKLSKKALKVLRVFKKTFIKILKTSKNN